MTFPTSFPAWPIANNDLLLFADVTDGNINKKATAWAVTAAGISSATTDLLPEWVSNRYMTNGEKTKIQWVEAGAQVNSVTSVNGQGGLVVLDLDDIPDGWTFVKSNQTFDNARLAQLTAANLHVSNASNPHNVTKAQVWLANVENIAALWRDPLSFDVLVEKTDVQLHLDDYMVVQDSSPSALPLWSIKKVKNQTDLIRKAAYIQIRWQSINYYAHTFVDSTTYRLRSLVTNGNNIYYCLVSHQSSGTFATDLTLWYRQEIWGGVTPWNVLSSGNGTPTTPWVNIWDVYVDVTNGDLYYWDGTARTANTAPQNFPVTNGEPANPGTVIWETAVDPATGIIYIRDGTERTANTPQQNFPVTNGAPANPGTVIWETAADPATGIIYIRDGTARTANQANSVGGWVNYDVNSTLGNKMTYSIGTGANTIAESSMWYDAGTDTFSFDWSAIEYNDVIENWAWDNVTNNDWTHNTFNYPTFISDTKGGTYNHIGVDENYQAIQISCQPTPAFATSYASPVLTEFGIVKIDYDDTINPVVSQNIRVDVWVNKVVDYATATTTWQVTFTRTLLDVAITITWGNPWFFSFAIVNPLCRYRWWSTINYDWAEINNTNTTVNNVWVTEVYDATSAVTYEWDVTFEW